MHNMPGRPEGRPLHVLVMTLICAGAGLQAGPSAQQPPQRLTFDEAVQRAIASHPTVQQAAINILRAETILQQVRSRSRPTVDASFTTNTIGPVTEFGGQSIFPRTQTVTSANLAVPLLTPVSWAQRNQAADQVLVSGRAAEDARRQVALAAGEAYLQIIAVRRQLELNEQARDNARAHFEFANQRYEGGLGSRLNALRAQQELSSDEARVETARLLITRAQEALGVLVAADGPVDAGAEPVFAVPPPTVPDQELVQNRRDLQAIVARQTAAQRVADDAWKDSLPSVTALFSPQVLAPSGLFADARSWRASIQFSVPVFDSGQRRGLARERQTLLDLVRTERTQAERQAASEIRAAREAVSASERALEYARRAAQQAGEVVQITDVAFREGATTNIEVIDAQRRARDAETAAAIAEDAVRRARLELLAASGRFPQ